MGRHAIVPPSGVLTTYRMTRRAPASIARRGSLFVLVASAMVIATPFPPIAAASTFTVNDTADLPDAAPGDGVCLSSEGTCTLRAAVMEANHSGLTGADGVVLPAGTYRLTIPETATSFPSANGGDLYFSHGQRLDLRGAGADVTVIEQTVEARVLSTGGPSEISGVTITGGRAGDGDALGPHGGGISAGGETVLRRVVVRDNVAEGGGGGVWTQAYRSVQIVDSVIERNRADGGGGVAGFGSVEIVVSRIRENEAVGGGGISFGTQNTGRVSFRLVRSIVARNTATGDPRSAGGGVNLTATSFLADARLEIVDSTIRGNTAGDRGGGIHHYGFDQLRINRSTISGNDSGHNGGGLTARGPVFVENSTFSGNTSGSFGGAIYGYFNPLCYGDVGNCVRNVISIRSATLAGNQALLGSGIGYNHGWDIQAVGTILANEPADQNCRPVGALDSVGSNMETGESCGLSQPSDHPGTDPLLRPLEANGGPSMTHMPRAASPAIDAYTFSRCPSFDQRLALRPSGARCDIGSVERGAAFLPTPLRPRPRLDEVGGSLALDLPPPFATSLKTEPMPPADGQGSFVTLPLRDGLVTQKEINAETSGGLLLLGGGRSLRLDEWTLHINAPEGFVGARVDGKHRVRLLKLGEIERQEPDATQITVRAVVALTKPGAALLRQAGAAAQAGTEGSLELHLSLGTGPPPGADPIEPP